MRSWPEQANGAILESGSQVTGAGPDSDARRRRRETNRGLSFVLQEDDPSWQADGDRAACPRHTECRDPLAELVSPGRSTPGRKNEQPSPPVADHDPRPVGGSDGSGRAE